MYVPCKDLHSEEKLLSELKSYAGRRHSSKSAAGRISYDATSALTVYMPFRNRVIVVSGLTSCPLVLAFEACHA